MHVDLSLGPDDLRILQLLFADGVDDIRSSHTHGFQVALENLAPRVEGLIPNTVARFKPEEIELIAKAVDLGRDKEESLIFDKRLSGNLEAIDRILAALVALKSGIADR
jgi:hypothetical protein